ncbi:MAG: DUF1573 domain-containing protein [Bacteroidetes bacterium]|nr:DUF1573 domain-containing protein [Bacteroidota bacterium]
MGVLRRFFALFFLISLCFSSFSQGTGPILELTTFRHDFGNILESKGSVSHVFPVENTGDDTLRILKFKTSSMNVQAEMIPSKLPPKGKGEIRITFDPRDESGKIEKFISIRSNDLANPIRQLGFIAVVQPRDKTVADFYPVQIGNLRFKAKHLAFDQFKNTEKRIDTFKVYNAWNKNMKLEVRDPPLFTQWKCIPAELKPGQQGSIIVQYDAGASKNWGLNLDNFNLLTNDSIEPEKLISIGVNIIEDFSYAAEKKVKTPRIEFAALTHDFGDIKPGIEVEHTFTFTNKGEGELVIRRIKASCGCTVPQLDKETIKPGEQANLKVKFNSTAMSGQLTKTVTVISNDPASPVISLSFTVNVGDK